MVAYRNINRQNPHGTQHFCVDMEYQNNSKNIQTRLNSINLLAFIGVAVFIRMSCGRKFGFRCLEKWGALPTPASGQLRGCEVHHCVHLVAPFILAVACGGVCTRVRGALFWCCLSSDAVSLPRMGRRSGSASTLSGAALDSGIVQPCQWRLWL